MRRFLLFFGAGLLLCASPALSGIVDTRDQLMTMLGANAVTDDFNGFNVGDGATVNTGVSYFDASTVVAGNGPGLVHAGATYSMVRAPLTWVGANYFGIPSRTIVCWNSAAAAAAPMAKLPGANPTDVKLFFAVLINFLEPVNTFGVDLWHFDVLGIVTVEIYDTAGDLISENFVTPPPMGSSTFFGDTEPGGIGAVVVKNTKFPTYYSPNIDDFTYGVATATPAAKTSWGRIKTLYR